MKVKYKKNIKIYARDWFTIVIWVLSYFLIRLFTLKFKINKVNSELLYSKKPIVFVSNHVAVFDPWIIFMNLPFIFLFNNLPIKIYAGTIFNKGFLKIINILGITGFIYFIYDCIKIPKDASFDEKIKAFDSAIKNGYSTLIFPEGDISKDGSLGKIKPGIAVLRKKNPNAAFVFVKILKTNNFFLNKKIVLFSKPSYEINENYLDFVRIKLNNI